MTKSDILVSLSIVFLSPFAHLFTRYPQRFHGIVPAATAASGEFRLASAARYLLFVISHPIFRAAENDANPFEGQPSHRRVVSLASLPLLLIVASRPWRVSDGMPRPLVKALPQKLRTGPTKMYPLLVPAPFRHRRDPTVGSAGVGVTLRRLFLHQVAPFLHQILHPTRGLTLGISFSSVLLLTLTFSRCGAGDDATIPTYNGFPRVAIVVSVRWRTQRWR